VRTVLVDGRVVLGDRRVTTVDEEELLRRVDALTGPYLARAGLAARPKWPLIG
jgi:5-methylthioadenosine/S-adenosylhomocysteine deaminase